MDGLLKSPWALGAIAVIGALLWVNKNGAANTGAAVGTAAVNMVDGVLSGTVNTIGETVGIPATSQTECEKAMAEGRTWDASFSCPAGTWLKYIVN